MAYPENERDTELCITVTKHGIKIYGNSQAFLTLSKWMSWIAKSDESDHYECHLFWHLMNYDSKEGKSPSNIWALFDKDTFSSFKQPSDQDSGFELTFMAVEKKDLGELSRYRESSILPDGWGEQNGGHEDHG